MKLRDSSFLIGSLVLLLLAALCFRGYATAQGVPLLGIDSRVFLPPVLPFHDRGELINQVWKGAAALDPTGERRMLYHGFLYPMLLAKMMWRGDYLSLAATLAILHALAAILAGALFLNFAQLWKRQLTPRRVLLVLAFTLASANYTQGALGRPDALAATILLLATIVASRVAARMRWIVAGIGIGTVTAVSPVVGMLAGLIFGGYATWGFRARESLLHISGAAAVSVGVFACWFLWYPYGFGEWLSGTRAMGNYAFGIGGTGEIWRQYFSEYFLQGNSWFLGGALGLVVWSSWRFWRQQRGPAAPALFYATLVVAIFAAVRFVFYAPWARYNLLPLMPLAFLVVFHEIGREDAAGNRKRSFYRPAALVILAVISLGFVGDLLERAHMLRNGTTLPEARARFAAIRARDPNAVIALDSHLFTLTEDYRQIVFVAGPAAPDGVDTLIVRQAFTGEWQPPTVPGFRLTDDYFTRAKPTGFPAWKRDRGCGFAAYVRATDSNAAPP